ncbi:hypothetical protein M378DRAFT_19127 [Amanita muscaria Koide BX008]|uniref:Uncharacterized protein n=1 Tax=Amanita muscaria (strain Koide BX008) TaxID=946122 RepID=A0A0C2VZD0_AMAMK|nr:hypothetical protein M378DRAFT_19127 [Amanita muscaria Koide BX008]
MLASRAIASDVNENVKVLNTLIRKQGADMLTLPTKLAQAMREELKEIMKERPQRNRGRSTTPHVERRTDAETQPGTDRTHAETGDRANVSSQPEINGPYTQVPIKQTVPLTEQELNTPISEHRDDESIASLAYVGDSPGQGPLSGYSRLDYPSSFSTRNKDYRRSDVPIRRQGPLVPPQEYNREPTRVAPSGTLADNTRQEVPVSDNEFEKRVLARLLELKERGKTTGSPYTQRPNETDSVYHFRLYQDARHSTRSSIRVQGLTERPEVRFQGSADPATWTSSRTLQKRALGEE